MAFSALPASGDEFAERLGAASPAQVAATLGRPEEPRITLSWMGNPRYPSARKGSWIERQLEERFAMDFRPIFIEGIIYERRVPLMLMGGNIPDVCWVGSAVDAKRNAMHGFALELPYELICRYAPNYVRLLQQAAPNAWLLSFHDGRNWGIPTFGSEYDVRDPVPGIWREDWLRNVGIERIPDTLDEMEEAFRRFRHNDPDGDGRKNTYGFCPPEPKLESYPYYRSFKEVFGAYGIVASGWIEREGGVAWGGIQPEAKTVLTRLQQWYADGLIYPDYLIKGPNDQLVRMTAGDIGYLVDTGVYHQFDTRLEHTVGYRMRRLHPEARLVPGRLPAGPDGRRGTVVWGGATDVIMFGRDLREQPEKVVRVLQMFDALAQDEQLYLESRIGRRGVHWEWEPDTGFRRLPPFEQRQHAIPELLQTYPSLATSWGFYVPFGAPQAWEQRWWTPAEIAYNREYRRPEWGLQDAILRADVVPLAHRYLGPLIQLQATVYSEIIRGERPVEAFDAFVTEWRRRGGDKLTAEANRLYREKNEIVARIYRLLEPPAGPRPAR